MTKKVVCIRDVFDFEEAQGVITRSLRSLCLLTSQFRLRFDDFNFELVLAELRNINSLFVSIDPVEKVKWKDGVRAFVKGTHPRLGENSPIFLLPNTLVLFIMHEARPRRAKAEDQRQLRVWAVEEMEAVETLIDVVNTFRDHSNVVTKSALVVLGGALNDAPQITVVKCGVLMERVKQIDVNVAELLMKLNIPSKWFSKAEYDESGPSIVHMRGF